jgi:hypothetical protein
MTDESCEPPKIISSLTEFSFSLPTTSLVNFHGISFPFPKISFNFNRRFLTLMYEIFHRKIFVHFFYLVKKIRKEKFSISVLKKSWRAYVRRCAHVHEKNPTIPLFPQQTYERHEKKLYKIQKRGEKRVYFMQRRSNYLHFLTNHNEDSAYINLLTSTSFQLNCGGDYI